METCPSTGRIVIVSGPPGAGKSSLARRLAETSDAATAVHLHTDDFYAYIRKGFILPWRMESRAQNLVVMDALAAAAATYARGGFEVVVDGIVGPWFLAPWQALRDHLALHFVVLRPDESTTVARATARGEGALTDPDPVRTMWRQFADLGPFERHVIDTTSHAVDETLEAVRAGLAGGRFQLA
ncbi:hypothetical protein SOCE26_018930 [Sorangium cellulosum]|uniref:Shikimate kinase n=1 Tax=Sorangium cellulosum TaxID=56 RepID=A0A2L0EMK8_SORCE|nr:AAA family ATPase [Sorangium cellulosum]AUX40492.1 hypothetical protein SOCE26_018930 [Sorangium cellulosum]